MNDVTTTGGAAAFDISDFVTNPELELSGVWRDMGKDNNGHRREIKLARVGNDEYNSLLRKKQKANEALLQQNDDEAFKIAAQISREVLAKTVIKGLRVDGVEVTKTEAQLIEMLKNRDFHEKVQSLASHADSYKDKIEEEIVKP